MSIPVPDVRRALVAVLGALHPAVRTYETIPHHPQVPCILIYPPETINYRVTRRMDVAVVSIVVLVSPQDPTAQETLEEFMSGTGDLSIREALYNDLTLGGVISGLRLLDMTSGAYSLSLGQDETAIGADFRVEISA